MRWKQGFVLLLLCIGYGLISTYNAYVALSKTHGSRSYLGKVRAIKTVDGEERSSFTVAKTKELHIWDTCGLGIYLWRNILGGELSRYDLNSGWIQSSLDIKEFSLRYSLGYGLDPDQALPPHPNVVLIINARADKLVTKAKSWLDHALKSAYIDNIAVMLLGSEICDNDWIQPYLLQKRIRCLFIVYDSPLVDDEHVFQWPLGVASYRNFQKFNEELLDLTATRQYLLNFVGTVYKESARGEMLDTVNLLRNGSNAFIKTRKSWVPEEDAESMTEYQHALLQSDLTLSPAGKNAECYRTYEAIELGSIPVIEDSVTEGTCDYVTEDNSTNITSPYRLLKRYGAPAIFVKDWEEELPRVVRKFSRMSHKTKVRSRINLLRWYAEFKGIMRDKFLTVINDKFFGTYH